jgi:hypothetical protein
MVLDNRLNHDYGARLALTVAARMVCLSKQDLVAVLSAENEGQCGGVNIYNKTPLCIIRRRGFVETENIFIQLARAHGGEDPNKWTLLHYAAANVLCDADPDEKAKRRTDRDLRIFARSHYRLQAP